MRCWVKSSLVIALALLVPEVCRVLVSSVLVLSSKGKAKSVLHMQSKRVLNAASNFFNSCKEAGGDSGQAELLEAVQEASDEVLVRFRLDGCDSISTAHRTL